MQGADRHPLRFSVQGNKKGCCLFRRHPFAFSQLPDLNRVPARYEGAALPGELSWQADEL